MSPTLMNGLKLCTAGSISLGAVGSGFVFLSLPAGILLKVTGAALTVLGVNGVHTLQSSMPDGRDWTDADLANMVQSLRSQTTYKNLVFNAALIGIISSCYLISNGVL